MSEMIDRVAIAFREKLIPFVAEKTPWPDMEESARENYRLAARAAIAAMREPTGKMRDAGSERFTKCGSLEPGEGLDEDPAEPLWQAMIDAILAEAPGL